MDHSLHDSVKLRCNQRGKAVRRYHAEGKGMRIKGKPKTRSRDRI